MKMVVAGLAKKLSALIEEKGINGKLSFEPSVINNWVKENGYNFEVSIDRVTGRIIVSDKDKK